MAKVKARVTGIAIDSTVSPPKPTMWTVTFWVDEHHAGQIHLFSERDTDAILDAINGAWEDEDES